MSSALRLVLGLSITAVVLSPVWCLVRSEYGPDTAFHAIYSGDREAFQEETLRLLAPLRNRRSANETKTVAHETVDSDIVSHFDTDDDNDHMILHIPANGNQELVFAYTRMYNYSKNFTSKLLVSHDYGLTFKDIAPAQLTLPNGQVAKIHQGIKTPASTQRYVFTDLENHVLFLTTDGCRNFVRRKLPFTPAEIVIDPRNGDVLIGRADESTGGASEYALWISTDFGLRWGKVMDKIVQLEIGIQAYDEEAGRSVLFAMRGKPNGKYEILRSSTYFLNETTRAVLIDDVDEFEMVRDFLFVTRREITSKKPSLQLWISYLRRPFTRAFFNSDKSIIDYFVSNTTKEQAIVAVTYSDNQTDLYFSSPGGTNFTKSLDNILFYHPTAGVGKFASLKQIFKAPTAFADVYRVHGMHAGVYIANQLVSDRSSVLGNTISLITYDNGANWIKIRAPRLDHAGAPTQCEAGHECYIHFMQNFPLFSASARPQHVFFSSHSAPGLIIGSGVLGESVIQGKGMSVFISTNGGFTFRETLNGVYHFAVGDHGGLIVAVNAIGKTNELMYSLNEGFSWARIKFADNRMLVKAVLTEPGEKQSTFSLFGTFEDTHDNVSLHEWKIIRVNLTKVFKGLVCQEQDFKEWTFGDAILSQRCLMGQQVKYTRKTASSSCQLGRDFRRKTVVENCTCQYFDFECDTGYIRSSHSDRLLSCEKSPGSSVDLIIPPTNCPAGTYWLRSRGYKKIPMNSCAGGASKRFEPEKVPCAWPSKDDFLLYAADDVVKRVDVMKVDGAVSDLSDMFDVKGDKITGLDYDYQKKCVFWSEVQALGGKLMRICFNGNSSRSLLAETEIGYPVAVAFDWMSRNLYWLDRKRGTVEAIRVDTTSDGRMRTIIIQNATLLSAATDLIVYPPKGIMFWSYVDGNNTAIYQANLDGTGIRVVDQTVRPSSLAFDYEQEKLIYSDHVKFIIGQISLDLGNSSIFGDMGYTKEVVRKFRRYSTRYVAPHRNRIFYSADNHDHLFVMARGSPAAQMLMAIDKDINVLKGYSPSQQALRGPCLTDTTCRTLCVSAPLRQTKCLCPDGFMKRGNDCLCPDGTPIGADGKCPTLSSCKASSHFDCGIGGKECIPRVWRCDGDADCANGRDEEDCDIEGQCDANRFQCADGTCILDDWRCDGEADCNDRSDEFGCPAFNGTMHCKHANQFSCKDTGKCIPNSYKCDMEDDCTDGSDEMNCPAIAKAPVCDDTDFRCLGDGSCLKDAWRCDGEADCPDGSDENNCENYTCTFRHHFKCNNTRCIPSTYRCDGMDDCHDNSDEENCNSSSGQSLNRINFECTIADGFHCGDGTCVPLPWKCDGVQDCGTGADELGCNYVHDRTIYVPCGPGTTLCVTTGLCVNASAHCDGVTDCPGGEDEKHCQCQPDEFSCGDGSHKCIPGSFVCDGDADCDQANEASSADELNCDHRPKCTLSEYQCRFSGVCIPALKECDGVPDCPQKEDEFGCPPDDADDGKCDGLNEFLCRTGGQCLSMTKRCNQVKDCTDGSDEEGCQVDLSLDSATITSVNVERSNITANSAYLYWNVLKPSSKGKSEGKNVTYVVRLTQLASGANAGSNGVLDVMPEISTDTTNVLLHHLLPFTSYRAFVRKSTDKMGRKDKFTTFITKMDQPTPPMNVRVAQTSHINPALRIDWNPPQNCNGLLRTYVVRARYGAGSLWSQNVAASQLYTVYNDVLPNTNYSVTVQAIVGTQEEPNQFQSNETSPVVAQVGRAAITVPVRNLKSSVNDTCVTLTWTKPNTDVDIDGYYVDHLETDERLEISASPGTLGSGGTRCDICHLRPATTYEFYVRAHSGPANQGPTAEVDVKTTGQLVPAPRISNVTATKSLTTAVISWTLPVNLKLPAGDTVYGVYYGITLHEALSNPANRMIVQNGLSAEIRDLQPCRSYLFLVRVDGPVIHSNFSESFEWQTLPDLRAPPLNVRVSKTATRSNVLISWNASCGAMTQRDKQPYMIHLIDYTTPSLSPYPRITQSFSGPSGNDTLGVRMGNKYGVKVRFMGATDSAYSEIVNFTTPTYESPEQFTAYQDINGSFVLSWSNPKSITKAVKSDGVAFRYNVTVAREGESERYFAAATSPFTLQLRPSTVAYSFRVAAVDQEDSVGERSPVVSVMGAYELPDEVSANDSSSASVIVPILVVVVASCLVGVIFIRRRRRNKRSGTSFHTTRFRNTPYGDETHDLDMEEDLPVFRAFADDEPLVNSA